jgi:hypothetical protein
LTSAKLKKLANAFKIDGYARMKEPEFVLSLLQAQNPEDQAIETSGNAATNKGAKAKLSAPMIALLKQSYLQPQVQKGECSKCKIGHQNKEPFIKAMWAEHEMSKNITYEDSDYHILI